MDGNRQIVAAIVIALMTIAVGGIVLRLAYLSLAWMLS